MNLIIKLTVIKPLATIIGLVSIVILSIVFQGCEKDQYEIEPLDEVILNSSELEEYIIAGADLQQSLAIFESRMNKIDLSRLEVTYDPEGRKVLHLPPNLVDNVRIQAKVHAFNQKKEAIQNKFPQFVSFRKNEAKKYIDESIENSVNVKEELLKFGVSTFIPRLKSGTEYGGAEDHVILMSDLAAWVNNPDYVEIYILYYADGSMSTYQNPNATASWTSITYEKRDGNMYFPVGSNNQVVSIGHTHLNSSTPSTEDLNSNYPSGVERFIYYNGTYSYY
ncbi:MAG: hypothetical protein ACK5HT_08710 [Draconibacterium sp.]